MAFTQTQIDAMKAALASGHLTVEYDGRRVTYRSTDELIKAINFAEAENAAAAGTPSVTYASFARD